MHILIIPSWYSTEKNPIRGSFFLDLAVALAHYGHQVGMLVPPSRFRTLHGLSEAVSHWRKSPTDIVITQDSEIPVYRMPWWGWIGSINLKQRVKWSLEVFDRYVSEQGRPDIIHGHSILYGGYLAAEIAHARGLPSIITEHNTGFIANQLQLGQRHTVRHSIAKTAKVLAVAPALAAALQHYTNQAIEIVGNVVDTDFFQPATETLNPSPFIFTIIGTLSKRKAQDNLLRAFATKFKDQDCMLHLAGDGPKRKNYEDLSRQLGIEGQVKFHGILNRAAIRELLQKTHVLVSSSHLETFGVTLIEAMACGIPVVATRSGGPEYIVDADSGLLVPTDNILALADALSQIRENYAAYHSEKIRANVIERFSETAIALQLTGYYESLIG